MKTYTWNRDSHGLFDYESASVRKNRISIQEPVQLFRNDSNIISSPIQSSLPNQPPFMSVLKSPNGYKIVPEPGSEMWVVIDCNRAKLLNKGFKLGKNDVVKLGRVKYTVKEVCGYEDESEMKMPIQVVHKASGEGHGVCRICLVEEEENDPLIAPCNCGGTMKFIHLSCFKKWIESKTSKKMSDNSMSYFVKSLTCEISRCPILPNIEVNGQVIDLLEIKNVLPPYITLESGLSEKNEYSIHLISLNNKVNVRLGRGHDSDIRISDISVSRCHAVIRYEDGEFHLEDNSSKFGTLVEGKEIEVNKVNPLVCIQAGRTLLVFSLNSQEVENPDISVEETDEEQEQ